MLDLIYVLLQLYYKNLEHCSFYTTSGVQRRGRSFREFARGKSGTHRRRTWIAPLLLATAAAALAGCAAVASYEKCGRAGCPGDTVITADVRRLYRQHPSIEAPNLIDVQTLDGVVYLYGTVDTDMQRQLATSVALEAAGVRRVVNAIGIENLGH